MLRVRVQIKHLGGGALVDRKWSHVELSRELELAEDLCQPECFKIEFESLQLNHEDRRKSRESDSFLGILLSMLLSVVLIHTV